jgi:uncharacterized protein (DUF885 family)
MDSKSHFEEALMSYLSYLYAAHPIFASSMGVHEYDSEMPHVHPHALREHMEKSRDFLHELDKISLIGLSKEMRFDYRLARAEAQMRIALFEQGLVYEKDPGYPVQFAMEGSYLLIARDYQSRDERAFHLYHRLKEIPRLLSEAKATLVNPVRLHLDHALECVAGAENFMKEAIPAWCSHLEDDDLQQAIRNEVEQVLITLEDYAKYIQDDLSPHASDDVSLGEEWYNFLLRVGLMLDDTGDTLLNMAEEWLSEEIHDIEASSRLIDGSNNWRQHIHTMRDQTIPYEQLRIVYREELDRAKRYIQLRNLTEDFPEWIEVEPMPAYAAGLCNAVRYVSAPPFEYVKLGNLWISPYHSNPTGVADYTQTIYDVTLNIINRIYPGIHTQVSRSQNHISRFRAHFARSVLFEEGWGAYCEEWMREMEYYTDPHMDLLRHYRRFINLNLMKMDILLHLGCIDAVGAIRMLQNELGMSEYRATHCVQLSAREPGRLICAAVGYHELMDLRSVLKNRLGTIFEDSSLPQRLQIYGGAPPSIIRSEILKNMRP